MSGDLFKFPKVVPEYREEIVTYRCTKYRTPSDRDPKYKRDFDRRTAAAAKVFAIQAEPVDKGDRIVYRESDASLEVFRASDSVWWSHDDLACPEKITGRAKLPGEKRAMTMADRVLTERKLFNKNARFQSVDYVEAAMTTSPRSQPKLERTAVTVNYGFTLSELPVFGPGAKVQVTFAGGEKLAEVLYFWREPRREKSKRSVIHPMEAITRVTKDPRFMSLTHDSAEVDLDSVELGYYALPPAEFQRYLIPVYAVHGVASTKNLPRYEFTLHVTAVRITPEEVKRLGIVGDPNSCTVF